MAIEHLPRTASRVTVSSKRQVTLPAKMVRKLGIEPGDKLVAVMRDDGSITLTKTPPSLLDYLRTFPRGTYGRTKEEIDAYVREERDSWRHEADQAPG